MDDGRRELDGWVRRHRTPVAVVAAVLGLACFALDFVVLRGEPVAHATARLDREEPVRLLLERVGVEHTFEISTRHRRRGEVEGRTLAWRLVAPDGSVVVEGSEVTAHQERFFSYTPAEPGEYQLHLEDNGLVFRSRRGSARVDVLVNDRRIFARLFAAF